MNDFWKSYDITHAEYGADYRCYPLYGTVHLMELAISLAFIVGAALWYRRSSARTRRRILVGVTALLLLDEAALLLGMALTGQWNWGYLPLHLCKSTSSSVCTTRSRTETGAKRSCMPSVSRAQCWHCSAPAGWMSPLVDAHQSALRQYPALLVLYPVLLVAGGYRPSPRRVPQVLAFLFGSALPIYFLNRPLTPTSISSMIPTGTSSPAPSRPCWAKNIISLAFCLPPRWRCSSCICRGRRTIKRRSGHECGALEKAVRSGMPFSFALNRTLPAK